MLNRQFLTIAILFFLTLFASCDGKKTLSKNTPLEEIAELSKKQGAELNAVKKRLAFCATEIAHGADAAKCS